MSSTLVSFCFLKTAAFYFFRGHQFFQTPSQAAQMLTYPTSPRFRVRQATWPRTPSRFSCQPSRSRSKPLRRWPTLAHPEVTARQSRRHSRRSGWPTRRPATVSRFKDSIRRKDPIFNFKWSLKRFSSKWTHPSWPCFKSCRKSERWIKHIFGIFLFSFTKPLVIFLSFHNLLLVSGTFNHLQL